MDWESRPEDWIIPAGSTIYTDGSMIDGPTRTLSRVGFGFAGYDEEGNVIAKAFGTPPAWIDTVPGAEAWAVVEALRNSVPGIIIWSECLSVVNRFKAGRKSATASKVRLARLWSIIFDLCEDLPQHQRAGMLNWIPAHTAEWTVGSKRKGDGSKLTKTDREGNAAADLLAKRGANCHRIPK